MKKSIVAALLTAVMVFSVFTGAEATEIKKLKSTATIKVGEYTSIDRFVSDTLMPDSYADYDGCSFKISNAVTSNKKVVAFYKNGKYYKERTKNFLVKGIKKGSAKIKVTGKYTETDEETVTVYDFTVTLTVNVKKCASQNADSAKKAKAILKKLSTSKKFAFVDLNYDGIKDLICGGKLYFYREESITDDEFIPSELMKQRLPSGFKIKKAFKSGKKLGVELDGKQYYTPHTTGDAILIENKSVRGDISFSYPLFHLLKLNKAGKKSFSNRGEYVEEDDDRCVVSYKVFKNIMKQNLPDKKAVKFYKNTKANRKKYIK